MHHTTAWVTVLYILFAAFLAISAKSSPVATNLACQIGMDLYEALPSMYKQRLHYQPVLLETNLTPFVRAVEMPDFPRPRPMVAVSMGFLTFVDNLSYAKAIDRVEPGYFQQYVARLAVDGSQGTVSPLHDISEPRYWSMNVINEKESYFNQMVAGVVAIELSHHYLAGQKKRVGREKTSELVTSVRDNLSDAEKSVSIGMQNALECGYGVEGLQVLYDAIERMTDRPAWALNLLPENTPASRLKGELSKQEHVFFHGK